VTQEAASAVKRKIAALLAADVAGYTRLVAEDEEETLRRLASYRSVFDDLIGRFGGRIFNTAGDAVLAEFPSAVDAVRCALDVQESLKARNAAYPKSREMVFRIGITIGDVVERDGDLLGDGVNIAARLQALAPPGGIYVSRPVYEAVANKVSVRFADRGAQHLKNLPQRVHTYLLVPDARPAARGALTTVRSLGVPNWGVLGFAGLAMAAAVAGYVAFQLSSRGPVPQQTHATRDSAPSPTTAIESKASAEAIASLPAPTRPVADEQPVGKLEPIAAPAPAVSEPKPPELGQAPAPRELAPRPPEQVEVARTDPKSGPHLRESSDIAGPQPKPTPTDTAAAEAVRRRYWRECQIDRTSENFENIAAACGGLLEGRHAVGADLARVEYTLARALRELGRVEDAIAAYTRAVAVKPTADALNNRGIAFYDSGAFDKAVADYTEAIRLDGQHGEAYNNRAWTQYKAGKLRAALADADKAVQLLASESYPWDTRAHIHEALGNKPAAIRDFRKALALDPANVASKEGLTRLGASP
jgi:class 3 adenylate cyclase/Tfp pilus assembly protein PilF